MAGDEDLLLATYVSHTRACLLHARGEWSAALAELRPLIERFRHGGHVAADLCTSTLEGRTLLVMGRRAEGLRRLDECRAAALERGLTGIARMADRALASDPARLPLGPQSGRDRAWSRLGEAIRAAAAGDAVRAGALLAEAPEQEGELGRLLAAVARAVMAMAAGDAAEAQALLASARADAIADGIDPELVPALLASVGSLRVVTAVHSRIARESEGRAGDEVRLDARTHDLASASRTVSLVKRPVLRRILYCLASRRGAVASKDALAAALWAREHNPMTDDGPLKSNIANLRKLIEEVGLSIDFDEVGYRLTGAERLVLVEPITWRVDPV